MSGSDPQFLLFVGKDFAIHVQIKQWAESNNGKPKWTTETKLRMAEIYHMLENRVEKDNQYGFCELKSIDY